MRLIRFGILVFVLLSASCKPRPFNESASNSLASEDDAPIVFSSIEPLKGISLSAPFAQIEASPGDGTKEYKGVLSMGSETSEVILQIKGKGRAWSCKMPTLKIDSASKQVIPFLGVKSINLRRHSRQPF